MKYLGIICITLISILTAIMISYAKGLREKNYQDIWCTRMVGKQEVRKDSTRCDCLTDEYAIEFDFAKKFHEAIGQALEYSIIFGKKPAIALIIESDKDYKYLKRLKNTINKNNLNIKIFIITENYTWGENKRMQSRFRHYIMLEDKE